MFGSRTQKLLRFGEKQLNLRMSVGFRRRVVGDAAPARPDDPPGRYTAPLQFRSDIIGPRCAQRVVDTGRTRSAVGGSRYLYGQTLFIRHAGQFIKIEPLRGVRQIRRVESEKEINGNTDTFAIEPHKGR